MARVRENVLVSGIRGHIGKQVVIRETNGQPIATKMPKRSKKKPSEAVQDQRWNFGEAAHLAKVAIRDPEKRPRYEAARRPGQSAYNVALAEYLNMFIAKKREPTPTPPYRKKSAKRIKTKDITLLVDTDNGTVVDTRFDVPDEKLQWLLGAARVKTNKKVRKIILLISCT